ncbi:hypothetical protein GWI34_37450 [Actinomadura sp. DSM 109109]|nr:hypothetical protein [Actinomadura lepetitiana]
MTIFDVHLLPTNSAAATALRKFVSSDGDISLRIENCTIDGEPVDAFVYRNLLPRSTREIKKAAQKFEETVKRLPLIA